MAEVERFWERLAPRAQVAGALAAIEDPETVVRLGMFTLIGAAASTGGFAALFFVFNEPVAGWSTLALAMAFLVTLLWYVVARSPGKVVTAVAVIVVIAASSHITVHLALGGFANSGAYLMWGVAVVLTAGLMLPRRATLAAAGFYAVTGVVLGLLEARLAGGRPPPDPALSTILFVIVLIGNLGMLVPMFGYFLDRLAAERARAEALLLNVLPGEVATELKRSGTTPARRFEAISVLFADVVGFTPLAADTDPEVLVSRLNQVFSHFDSLADTYGCEKIRTIGDAYMVASGVPVARPDHAQALAAMALDMLAYQESGPLRFRIGINSGPVVAGVIGIKKFQYDVWGDTVNVASRMESHGEPGRIQISEATYELIRAEYRCAPHGPLEVKGKGTLNTWFLEGAKEVVPARV
jgi:guanylate cyclase